MKFNYTTLETCSQATGMVIIIDVLRAFSTAAYAFHVGAESICLVSSVDEALSMKKQNPELVLIGEVGGLPPDGFDFGNSPTKISQLNLKGKHLVQRTSAGTQGAVRCINAQYMLATSFVVSAATVRYVRNIGVDEVTFVITGSYKNDEDLACAEFLEALFENLLPPYSSFISRITKSKDAIAHLDPEHPEFPETDLYYCSRINAFNFCMPIQRSQNYLVMQAINS
jgi:2-phosphosulfolactate phosphatase